MKIKVKNSELNSDTIQSLNYLIDLDINGSSAFILSRIIKIISSIIEDKAISEKRIFEKWVRRDESGKYLSPKDDKGNKIDGAFMLIDPEKFSEEINSLMSIENEIPYDKIKFEDLRIDKIKIQNLLKLDFIFE